MKKVLYVMMVSVIAGMAVLLSCGKSGNYVTGPSGSNPSMTMTGTCRVSGDSIYVAISYPADTSRYCNGASLEVYIDSAHTDPESGIPYSISNNTLTLTATDSSMNGAGYTMAMVMTFSRVGMGGSVEGTWNFVSESYTILAGTAPDSIRQRLDSMNTAMNQMFASGQASMQYIFSSTQFTEVVSYSPNWADYYVSSWTNCNQGSYGTDTCSYAVTVVKLNNASVQLHGKTSGETVTISFKTAGNTAGDITFTSSDATHPTGTYYAKPVTCPNSIPDWFTTFLAANAKTGLVLPKKSAQQMVPKKPSLLKWPRVF